MIYEAKLKDFVTAKELKKKLGVDIDGEVQKDVDAGVIRYCSEYVPFSEGVLAGSANTATQVGSGEVSYDTQYAHYLYYGEIYGPNIPIVENGKITGWRSPPEKYKTGRELHYQKTEHSPLAGSHWFDRAMADHAKDLLEDVQHAADRRRDP